MSGGVRVLWLRGDGERKREITLWGLRECCGGLQRDCLLNKGSLEEHPTQCPAAPGDQGDECN